MKINNISSYNINSTCNNNLDCRKKQNPNFTRLAIDGEISLKLTSEALKKGLLNAYEKHYNALRNVGIDGSVLHMGNVGNGRTSLSLALPNLTDEYQKPVAIAQEGKFLETWLGIKPSDITEATQDLINFVQSKNLK